MAVATPFDSKQFPRHPGVYQMLDGEGTVIYVGKAKDLKARVSSYFRQQTDSPKTQVLVSRIADIKITLTPTEKDALLLEHTLIKHHRPRYNVLLRDDKSYPYIYLNVTHAFPRLQSYRGVKRQQGQYFGPYPSTYAVKEALQLMQKLFKIRSCRDSFFQQRKRPCLQYQIDRCKAPCVALVSASEYQQDVQHAVNFLQGKSQQVISDLADQMEQLAEQLAYEKAAEYRDLIRTLKKIQEQQSVISAAGDVDVIGIVSSGKKLHLAQLFFREGHLVANKSHSIAHDLALTETDVLSAFIAQYYLDSEKFPTQIVVPQTLPDQTALQQALTERAPHTVVIQVARSLEAKRWLQMAKTNAEQQAGQHTRIIQRVEELQTALGLTALPQRMECFDISHTQGSQTVASCVVFEKGEPKKSDYRRFNITGIQAGDDYAAMKQAVRRRYQRLQKTGNFPDLLVIDGGKGQITQAQQVLISLQIDTIALLGIAKGSSRKPGLETLYFQGNSVDLSGFSSALHLLQHIRDEAHRFAITGHRQQRGKVKKTSTLEQIDGVGAKRRRELLRHYGGLQALKQASVDDIAKVPSINRALAARIVQHFKNTSGS